MKKDSIIGRPIRVNKQTLITKKGKDYAEVIFLGDVHLGSPQCDKKRFLNMLDYCIQHKLYIFLMGDLLEMSVRDSVGAGVYEQDSIGQTQYEEMVGCLKPLAKKKLILGVLEGNHEKRIYDRTGVNLTKMLARELSIPFLGDACWNIFKVGKQNYSVYSLHGRTGAKFDGTALLAIERISASFNADCIVMGHCHKLVSSTVIIQEVKNKLVKEHKKLLLITGGFLTYDGGYAQTIGMPISKLGSPKVKFFASKKDFFVSW